MDCTNLTEWRHAVSPPGKIRDWREKRPERMATSMVAQETVTYQDGRTEREKAPRRLETRPWILTSRVCHPTHAPVRGCPYLSAHNSRVTLKSLWTNGSGSPVTELDKSNEHCIAFGIFGYFGPCIDPWTNWIYIRKISSWEVAQLETSRQTFIDKIYELDNSIQIILFYLPVSAASRGLKY